MLYRLFSGITFTTILARIIVLLTAIPVHEFAHAWAADRMGDPSARHRKRLTLNPLDHIDPVGALMILLLGFGFARPVPVNSMNFRDRRAGMVVTSLAGPFANILMALASMILAKLMLIPRRLLGGNVWGGAFNVFSMMVLINLSLAVFNLLPIPPLDGWHAASALMSPAAYWRIAPYERQIVWVVLILAATGFLSPIIGFFINPMFRLLDRLTFFVDIFARMVT